MKSQVSATESLVVSLTVVLLAVAMSAGAHAQGPVESQAPPAISDSAQHPALDSPAETGSAPAGSPSFAVYVPGVFNGYNPSGCIDRPTLVAPPNNSRVDTLMPTYQWSWGTNPYATETWFQVAWEPEFIQPRYWAWTTGLNGTIAGPVYSRPLYNLTPDRVHYWRVFVKCGQDRTLYSDVWSFTPNSGGPMLPPPALLAPANNALVTSAMVTLQWVPLDGATRYIVRYRSVGGLDRFAGGPDAFAIIGPLSAGTTYEWSVSGVNNYAIGAPSQQWRFTIQ